MSKEKRKLGDYEIIQSIYIGDKEVINDLQKSIKANKVISFLGGDVE